MNKARWVLVFIIICISMAVAGFRLTQPEPQLVSAAPVPPAAALNKTESLEGQTLATDEAAVQGETDRVVFVDEKLGYHISYPLDWVKVSVSTTVTLFQSPTGDSQVKVEAVGPLSKDGLGPFVDRSIGNDIVFSRQQLSIHGLPAERVVAFSEVENSPVTTFYLNQQNTVFVIRGAGQQQSIELIARSFNAPQVVAWR